MVVCLSVGLSVGLFVTLVSPAKTAAPIELPFGLRTCGTEESCIRWGSRSPREGAIFGGEWASHCKVQGHSTVVCGKTAEPIEMPLTLWVRAVLKNHKFDGVPIPHGKGQFLGENGRPIVKYRDTLRSSVQKRLNR